MAQRATLAQRLITPTSSGGLDPTIAATFNWGRASKRTGATDFYGVPDLSVRSKVTITGVAEVQSKLRQLHIQSHNLRVTNLQAAVKLENAIRAEAPIARGPSAYWRRPKSNPKPPAGGLKRSIRSFASDAFGQVDAGGGLGSQHVGGQLRSMTGEFTRGGVGGRGQRIRTIGGKGSLSAKNLSTGVLDATGGRSAQYGAGKGTVVYAGPIHFGWNTRPNPQKRWFGGPIKPNPFMWRAYQRKQPELRRVYENGFKKMIKKVGL